MRQTRPGGRARALRPVAVGLAVLALIATPVAWRSDAVAAPGDQLPDLAMARPLDLHVQITAAGRRLLRLTTNVVNIGTGPLETRASRRSASESAMIVKQRIYNSSGGYRVITTPAVATYSGDGHDHWHVQHVAHYDLYPVSSLGTAVARSSKVGFCFFDTHRYRALPGSPTSIRYDAGGCGTRTTLAVKNGISVGWADRYGWDLRFQAIDVTALPAGDYLLKVTADPFGAFVEGNELNNCNWTRIRLRRSGALLSVLDWGSGCTLPGAIPVPSPTPTPSTTPSPTPGASPLPGVSPTPGPTLTPP